MVPGIKPRAAFYKANALPTVLQPLHSFLYFLPLTNLPVLLHTRCGFHLLMDGTGLSISLDRRFSGTVLHSLHKVAGVTFRVGKLCFKTEKLHRN